MSSTVLPSPLPVLRNAFFFRKHSVLPGFSLALGYSVIYLALIVLIPLAAVFLKSSELGFGGFWNAVTQPRVLASFKLSFGASLIAAAINIPAALRNIKTVIVPGPGFQGLVAGFDMIVSDLANAYCAVALSGWMGFGWPDRPNQVRTIGLGWIR